jgi:hypothetical protein
MFEKEKDALGYFIGSVWIGIAVVVLIPILKEM